MRLWLKDSERRPDPEAVRTDDRKPVIIGTAAWVIALVVLLITGTQTAVDGAWMWTCAAGATLGLAGLVYTQRLRGKR